MILTTLSLDLMKYKLLSCIYKITHPKTGYEKIPYWWKRSLLEQVWHSIRKFICQNIAPNCVTNFVRIRLYRLCGFKIGGGTFIGMRCYLDDLCYDKIEIGKNVTISYGVYFACHGRKQGHNRIIIKDGAYIGMRVSVVAPKGDVEIGENAIVGAQTLVNKSIPAGETAVGVPCRIIKHSQSGEMEEYKLYHGAWMSKEAPHKTQKINNDDASQLLNGGGIL